MTEVVASPLRDAPYAAEVLTSEDQWTGPIFSVRRDTFEYAGERLTRDVVAHLDAVAVVALDEAERVLLVRQYRHPVGRREWELPAGLADVPGEPLELAARRELVEETDHDAADWEVLLRHYSSPGFTDEHLTTFLARGVAPVPAEQRHTRTEEEADMEIGWFPLADAVAAAVAGDLQNVTTIAGLLAAERLIRSRSPRNAS